MIRPTLRHWSAAALAALALSCAPGQARASGTIGLQGSVNKSCYVVITPDNTSLNIVAGVTNQRIGTIGERCNDKDGFRVTISSVNGGALVNGTVRAPYTISYSGRNNRSLSASEVFVRNSAQNTVRTRGITVSMPANSQAIAGAYWDTITVTIAAK